MFFWGSKKKSGKGEDDQDRASRQSGHSGQSDGGAGSVSEQAAADENLRRRPLSVLPSDFPLGEAQSPVPEKPLVPEAYSSQYTYPSLKYTRLELLTMPSAGTTKDSASEEIRLRWSRVSGSTKIDLSFEQEVVAWRGETAAADLLAKAPAGYRDQKKRQEGDVKSSSRAAPAAPVNVPPVSRFSTPRLNILLDKICRETQLGRETVAEGIEIYGSQEDKVKKFGQLYEYFIASGFSRVRVKEALLKYDDLDTEKVTQYLSLCGDLEPKGFSPSEISRAVDIVGLESARVERLLNGTRALSQLGFPESSVIAALIEADYDVYRAGEYLKRTGRA